MARRERFSLSSGTLTPPRLLIVVTIMLTLAAAAVGLWLGIRTAHLTMLIGLLWLPVLAWVVRARGRQVGITRTSFELILAIQLLHLVEHLIQMAQLFVLRWPPSASRGLVSTLDVEKVHFLWNLVVLVALGWLLCRGLRSAWLTATVAWATLHTAEHSYLLVNALRTGLESQPGILGANGLLATWGWQLGGLTSWSRPTVHFAWNLGEVTLLTLAFIALMFPHWMPRPRLRVIRQAIRHPAVTLALLLVALIPSAAHAPSHTLYVNNTDPTCQGQAPCYSTIQAAISATTSSDVIIIQPGTYSEQLSIQGKNNFSGANETHRIRIEADPAAPVGSVVLTGAVTQCTNGYAIRLQQSKFITLRGLTITGAGGQAISLMGGNNQNVAIVIERNRIFDNGGPECNGGITVARGNPGTLIVNNLIYANGRNGITFLDADGGPHAVVENTIHGNAWNGISVARNHFLVLVNNLITQNGTASGSTGGRFGVTREGSSFPLPWAILLTHNMLCGNRLGEINGPALDGTDSSNFTPTGTEGPGVVASPGCNVPTTLFANLNGPDGQPNTGDDDFTLATNAPAIDQGLDVRTFLFDPIFAPLLAILQADYTREGARPQPGSPTATAQFDIGAMELNVQDTQAPTVTFLQPPAGAFVRGTITVEAQADDNDAVASFALAVDSQPLSATLTPAPPAATITATATLNTTTLADGTHTLTAVATDEASNSATATRVIIIDNTPPETQIDSGPSGEIATTSATFTFSGSDTLTPPQNLQFAYRLDGGPWSAFSPDTSASFTTLAEGPHTFDVKARDLAGNEDPTPASRSFTVRLGPSITSVDPASGSIGTFVTINGGGFEPGATQVRFNGVSAVIRTITATTITTTVPPGATTGLLTVTTSRGSASRAFTVTTSQDFTIQAAPADAQTLQGASATYTIELLSTGTTPFTGLATLTVEGLPSGLSASFGVPTLTGGQRGTLTVTASPTAPLGLTPFTIRATAPTETGSVARSVVPSLTVLAGNRTALLGQVTFVDGTPIEGVQLFLGSQNTATDTGGNFLFLDPPAGTQTLGVNANAAQAGLPIYNVDVVLAAGQATQLAPFRITPPPPLERFTPINNATQDQVITDPRFPGASITLPAGVTITGWDGTLKTKIAMERLSPDALPMPPPPFFTQSFYQYFFGTPMGGLPSAPLPVTLPNDQGLEPGEKTEIWYYDAAPFPGVQSGWRLAGSGTVSDDGSTVVSDPGVGIPRFCGICGAACFNGNNQPNGGGPTGGEPVDLALGQMIVEKTDLVVPGRLPLVIHRHYNPFEPFGGVAGFELGLGPGWGLSIEVALLDFTTLKRLILPGNVRFDFVRQPNGTFINTTHPRMSGAILTIEPSGHVLRFKDGSVWRFAFNWRSLNLLRRILGLGLLIEQTDRAGNRLTLERNIFGGLTRLIGPDGRALTFTLEFVAPNLARFTEIRDPLGRSVRYQYSAAGRLERVIDPLGGITRYTYDSAGRILTITDPRGITFLTNEYDAQGRVVRQLQADGGVWTFQYEGQVSAHTRVTVTDPRGNSTTHRLTPQRLVSETIDALGQPTRFERDAQGQLLSSTDALGRVTRFEYDAAGNVKKIFDPEGNTREFTYDPAFNKVTSILDPLNNLTTFEYDAQGNLTAITDPEQNLKPTADRLKTRISYNAVGQPETVTDPLGNPTTFGYNGQGDLVTIAGPLGNTTTREYDSVSRFVRQTDPLGQITGFLYDPLNRIEQIIDAAAGVTQFSYDANGNLLTVTDARNNTITHEYDTMDRLSRRVDQLAVPETFEYDGMGNLTRHTDRKGQVSTFSYDGLNRRVGATYADSTTSFVYDAGGRLIRAVDSVGGEILNSYDTLDRLLAQATTLGTVSYEYDQLGRRRTMTAPGQLPVSYTYDAASRLVQIVQNAQVVDFQYDALGRRTKLTLPNQVSTEYQYDTASRLTALIYRNALGPLGDLTYAYDATGNRTAVGGSFARTLLPDPVVSATYDAANRQLAFGSRTLTYDFNGNTTNDGINTYTWNARDQLTAISGSATSSFLYDSLGRRVRKTLGTAVTEFLYDGFDVVQELAGGAPVNYLRSLTIDEALGRGSEFYLADALGSSVALADPSGALMTQYTAEPFGRTTAAGAASTNPVQWSGREHDESTGLYFLRARYYHPQLQRFVSEDPWGLAAGDVNFYAYVANNPVTLKDPLGLWSRTMHANMTRNTMRAAGEFSERDIQIVVDANLALDNWRSAFDPDDPQHYMPGTAEAAERFIADRMRQALEAGGRDQALKALGEALHTIQDKWAHGETDVPGTIWQHILGRLGLGRDPDDPAQNEVGAIRAQQDTERLLRDFQRGRGSKKR